jgi:predicted N-acetyltransferase YhbS
MRLRREREEDWWEVEELYDLCFAPGREALSSYRLREGVPQVPDLCLIARDPQGAVAAAIRHWPVRVGTAPVLLLGPVAVHPTHQGEGLGAGLIRESMARAAPMWERVVLVGDLPYYARLGFSRLDAVRMPAPTNPDRVLGCALVAGAWEGIAGDVVRWEGPLPEVHDTPSDQAWKTPR